MKTFLISIAMGATIYGVYKLIVFLFQNPYVFRPSFHRRNSFMKKWRDHATDDALVNFQYANAEKLKECFQNAEIIKGATPEWQVVRAEYKGVPFSVYIKNDQAYWLQLPPFYSVNKSLSFEQQRDLCTRFSEDFAPIRTNVKKEDGSTNFYLVGEYIDSLEAWEKTDNGLWLECADKESAEANKLYYSEFIPQKVISINEETLALKIPTDYKSALIKAESPYYPSPKDWVKFGGVYKDVPDQPFTSNDGIIISPSADLVKAWIELYLFVKEEFTK